MAHVLSFGTIWEEKGLNPVFGSYTGANALREYKSLLGKSSTPKSIPLETGGGARVPPTPIGPNRFFLAK